MEKEKKILVGNGDKKILKKEFETTYYTVRNALNGETTTALGYKIRKRAIELGGVEIIPEEKQNNIHGETPSCSME